LRGDFFGKKRVNNWFPFQKRVISAKIMPGPNRRPLKQKFSKKRYDSPSFFFEPIGLVRKNVTASVSE